MPVVNRNVEKVEFPAVMFGSEVRGYLKKSGVFSLVEYVVREGGKSTYVKLFEFDELIPFKDVIIDRYTGLEDIFNKRIYSSDVVLLCRNDVPGLFCGVVETLRGEFVIKNLFGDNFVPLKKVRKSKHILPEVVGIKHDKNWLNEYMQGIQITMNHVDGVLKTSFGEGLIEWK